MVIDHDDDDDDYDDDGEDDDHCDGDRENDYDGDDADYDDHDGNDDDHHPHHHHVMCRPESMFATRSLSVPAMHSTESPCTSAESQTMEHAHPPFDAYDCKYHNAHGNLF
eukprot:3582114-Karenia_brevis.AAC.1